MSGAPGGGGLSGFDMGAAIGGPRGLVESALPGALFVLLYTTTRELSWALAVSLASAGVLVVLRLLRRETIQHAVSGMLGIAIGAAIAWFTGEAKNFFIPSLIRNPVFAIGYAVSIFVRWPLIGVIAGAMLGESTSEWRSSPQRLRAYNRATWLWVALFTVRFVVQFPLWLADEVDLLGAANVVLGVPLYALTLLGTWYIVRKPKDADADAVAHSLDEVAEGPAAGGTVGRAAQQG